MLKYHIQTVELTSAQASISFNSIPQDFTDLVFLFSARENATGFTGSYLVGSFNSTTAGYSIRIIEGNGSSAGSATFTSGIDARIMATAPGAVPTANTFSNGSLYIPNYTSSNNKSYSSDSVWENNATTAVQEVLSGLWSNSAAITSATFTGWAGFNLAAGTSISLYGVRRGSDGKTEVASGGVITTSGGYTIHTFNTSGTFVANRDLNVEYLVVAGGGGGGVLGGGGGAGGYRSSVTGELSGGGASAESTLLLNSGSSYAVIVGAGGIGAPSHAYPGTGTNAGSNGSNSQFFTINSIGGGKGGEWEAIAGLTGGSGGGSAINGSTYGGVTGQGYAGGDRTGVTFAGSGGGGAGSAGQSISTENGGNGGSGVTSSISGFSVPRAGGGGGGAWVQSPGLPGAGGLGGGGNGANNSSTPGGPGLANTGGGGGASGFDFAFPAAGNGGSGVVIIRYLTP